MKPTLSEETVGAATQNGMTLNSHASFNFHKKILIFLQEGFLRASIQGALEYIIITFLF